jgi:hypothetical protein
VKPGNSSRYCQRSISPNEDEAAKFTSVILATTEDTWGQQFEKMGRTYQPPKLVMYRGATRTGCGTGQSVMGPFYCPADSTVYIDLSFYDDMKSKLGADGDFAQGYVIAHEVGHHVQKLLGIEPKVRQMQQNASQAEVNRLSVRMELQADCFAGVWGYYTEQKGILEAGDLEEALNAAHQIATTRCSAAARVMSCRKASITALRPSVPNGSSAVSTAASWNLAIHSAATFKIVSIFRERRFRPPFSLSGRIPFSFCRNRAIFALSRNNFPDKCFRTGAALFRFASVTLIFERRWRASSPINTVFECSTSSVVERISGVPCMIPNLYGGACYSSL